MCQCSEGKIDDESGVRVRSQSIMAHNCAYIEFRNSLILQAERYADAQFPNVPGYERGGPLWSQFFSKKMNELVHATQK